MTMVCTEPARGPHQFDVRVYYEDTDAGGVVFYANYLKFMERARTEWLRELGVSQALLAQKECIMFIVAQLEIRYVAPARLDQLLHIHTNITRLGRASLNFDQRVMHGQELLAQGSIKVGCVSTESMNVKPLPAFLIQRIKSSLQE